MYDFLGEKNYPVQHFCSAFRGEQTKACRSSIPFPRSEEGEKLGCEPRSVHTVLPPFNIWPIQAQACGHSEMLCSAPRAPLGARPRLSRGHEQAVYVAASSCCLPVTLISRMSPTSRWALDVWSAAVGPPRAPGASCRVTQQTRHLLCPGGWTEAVLFPAME